MPAQPNVSSGPADPQVLAGQAPHRRNGNRPRWVGDFDRFWARVSEGRELSELWSQFKHDAQSGYQFYQKDFRSDEAAGHPRWRQFVEKAKALMWALLEKLT